MKLFGLNQNHQFQIVSEGTYKLILLYPISQIVLRKVFWFIEKMLIFYWIKNILLYKNKKVITKDNVDTSNCWNIPPANDKIHSAIFSQELCNRVLKYYSYDNDVVLDLFAGSGSFGVAAINTNRIPVSCEINKNYINYIKERIRDYDYN